MSCPPEIAPSQLAFTFLFHVTSDIIGLYRNGIDERTEARNINMRRWFFTHKPEFSYFYSFITEFTFLMVVFLNFRQLPKSYRLSCFGCINWNKFIGDLRSAVISDEAHDHRRQL